MEKKQAFNEFITYYQPTRTKDSLGQMVETFTPFQKAFVSFEKYVGNEEARGEQIAWSQYYLIMGHYIAGIDTTFRILYDGVYYAILDVDVFGGRKFMMIKADKVIE